ncbi:MAG: hypothetical protein NTV22_17750 [bacterium]|nr:hypothetical protein [bacterium]
MQREPDNDCRSTDAVNVHATIGFARGRWQLRVGGLELEQAAAAGPIVLHAALQLGTPLVVFDERTEYTATVLAKPSRNIVY